MSDVEEPTESNNRRRPGRPRRQPTQLEAVQRRAAELEEQDRTTLESRVASANASASGAASEDGEDPEDDDEPDEAGDKRPAGRHPAGFGTIPDSNFNRGSGIAPSTSAVDLGLIDLIDEWINKLRRDPQAYAMAWRTRPEYHEGKPSSGVSGRWSIQAIKDASDLLAELEQESGGYVYQIRFYGYDSNTAKVKVLKVFGNVPINAPPILRGEPKEAENTKGGHVLSPDVDLTKANMELLRSFIKDHLTSGGQQGRESTQMMQLVKEIADSKNDFLMKEIESLRASQGNPSSETITRMQNEARKEMDSARERWEADRAHDRERWEEERKVILREHKAQLDGLHRDHKEQVDKLVEKMESAQNKLKDREESYTRERADRERAFDDRLKHREELNQRDIQSLRDQRDADVKRLADQLADERRASDRIKELYDVAKGTELSKQEGIFREQIKGQEQRLQLLEQRIHDLEKQKEDLQRDLVNARSSRPDALSSMKDTLGAVMGISNMIRPPDTGKGEPAAEMRTEMGQLLKDAKDAGVIDAAKGVVERVAGAFAQRGQQQQQFPGAAPGMPYGYPGGPSPGAFGIPGAIPLTMSMPMSASMSGYPPLGYSQPAPFVPPQPPPPPAPAPRPTPVASAPVPVPVAAPATAPAPAVPDAVIPPEASADAPEVSEEQIAMMAIAVKQLEEASDSGEPILDVAKKIVAEVPRLYLVDIVNAGIGSFQDMTRKVCARRPEEPDSVLLTPRGEAWLRDLFNELRHQMAAAS